MQVTQPNEFYKGLPKEDVFFVKDDQNNPVGEGFLIYQYQPTISLRARSTSISA